MNAELNKSITLNLIGTPLIDIKPFFKNVDNRPDTISGWLEDKDADIASKHRSDDRFTERKSIHKMGYFLKGTIHLVRTLPN